MTDAMTRHSDAEVLAAFVDGQLDREQLQAVATHLASCQECRGVIGEAAAFQREEAHQAPRRAWLAIAAAVIIAVIAFPLVRGFLHQRAIRNSVQGLFAAEGETGRNIEARFSGQNTHGRLRRTMRGPEDVPLEIQAAAGGVLATTEGDDSPNALRARALASAELNRKPSLALDGLLQIPMQQRDGRIWNDIAAAEYGTAVGEGKPELLKDALAAVGEALRRDKKMPEALFNRALILKKMNNPGALQAWNDYLAVDPQGPWADEARKNLPQSQ